MKRMRTIGVMILAAAALAAGGTDTSNVTVTTVDAADSAQAHDTVHKTLNVPRPKTSWSKLKELFM